MTYVHTPARFFALACVSTLILFSFAAIASAQEDELPEAGMLPGSPFYFLERLSEGIGTVLTFGNTAKAERMLALAEERLAEVKAETEAEGDDERKQEAIDRALARYEAQLGEAVDRSERAFILGEVDERAVDVSARVSEATLKHQAVLAEVYERVPEEAKQAIERAMENSSNGHTRAVGALKGRLSGADGEVPEAVAGRLEAVQNQLEARRNEVEGRLEALRNQGVPIPDIPAFDSIPARTRAEIENRHGADEGRDDAARPERGSEGIEESQRGLQEARDRGLPEDTPVERRSGDDAESEAGATSSQREQGESTEDTEVEGGGGTDGTLPDEAGNRGTGR